MSYISQKNLEELMNGLKEFFKDIFEAIHEGRLDDALTIAEHAMAFITETLDKEEDKSEEDTNLFVFVESPQGCGR